MQSRHSLLQGNIPECVHKQYGLILYINVRGSNPGKGTRFSASVQVGPRRPPPVQWISGRSQGLKRPGRVLTTHAHLEPSGHLWSVPG